MHLLRVLSLVAVTCALGCSTHYSTLKSDFPGQGRIYRLSEPEALYVAHNALVELFPGRQITEIEGPTRGYHTYIRFVLDTHSQQVLAVPAVGLDAQGQEVHGYWFEVSGSGSAFIQGGYKNSQLFDRVTSIKQEQELKSLTREWTYVERASAKPAADTHPAIHRTRRAPLRISEFLGTCSPLAPLGTQTPTTLLGHSRIARR
jgi:hypothetical protein